LYKNLDRSFFRFVTIHAFDGQTDRRTDSFLLARPRLHFMHRGIKTSYKYLMTVSIECCENMIYRTNDTPDTKYNTYYASSLPVNGYTCFMSAECELDNLLLSCIVAWIPQSIRVQPVGYWPIALQPRRR